MFTINLFMLFTLRMTVIGKIATKRKWWLVRHQPRNKNKGKYDCFKSTPALIHY